MDDFMQETIDVLGQNGKTLDDVVAFGSTRGYITRDQFVELATGLTYNSGFGGQEVAKDLVIVGDGWWLERDEYDGSEWWSFKTTPDVPDRHLHPTSLYGVHDDGRRGHWGDLGTGEEGA